MKQKAALSPHAMTNTERRWSVVWLLALAGASLLIYGSGLRSGYFSDDFSYYHDPLPSNLLYFFNHQNPSALFYRPLQSTFVLVVQHLWGLETLPIHLVTLFCHVILAWLVALTVVRLGYSRLQGMIGSAFFLVAQVNVYAVLSNDTLSQVAGVLFGCLAPWLLYFPGHDRKDAIHRRRPAPLYYLLSILSLAVSLMLKETSTAYLAIVAVTLLLVSLEQHATLRQAMLRTALQLIPFLLLVIIYMIVRSEYVTASPQFGDSRYDLKIGFNIAKNIGLFLAASLTANSSVSSFVAMQEKDIAGIAATALSILPFVALLAMGLWRVRRERPVMIFLLLYFFGFFPAILFNRVSEHYIYNSFPFLGALVGIAIGKLYSDTTDKRAKVAIGVIGALLLVVHVAAVQSKAALIDANAARASDLLEQLRPIVRTAPQNGMVSLVSPPDSTTEYSIYIMNGFKVLEAGFPGVQTYLGRPDLTMNILLHSEVVRGVPASDSVMLLTLKQGRVVPMSDSLSIGNEVLP